MNIGAKLHEMHLFCGVKNAKWSAFFAFAAFFLHLCPLKMLFLALFQ